MRTMATHNQPTHKTNSLLNEKSNQIKKQTQHGKKKLGKRQKRKLMKKTQQQKQKKQQRKQHAPQQQNKQNKAEKKDKQCLKNKVKIGDVNNDNGKEKKSIIKNNECKINDNDDFRLVSNHMIERQNQRNISNGEISYARRHGIKSVQNDGSIHYRANGICYVTKRDINTGNEIGITAWTENQLEFENAVLNGKVRVSDEKFKQLLDQRVRRPFKETHKMVVQLDKKLEKQKKEREKQGKKTKCQSLENELYELIDQKQYDDLCIAHGIEPYYANKRKNNGMTQSDILQQLLQSHSQQQ